MKSLKLLLLSALLVTFIQRGKSQAVPFWTENFTNGFPAGWSNTDASGQNVLWTWCNDAAAGPGQVGCPSIWNDGINEQDPFGATTASTGILTLDSDEYLQLPENHISELTTSAINCTGKAEVWLTFQTHIGVYNHDARTDAILMVSNDSIDWIPFQVFFHDTRWSKNPEIPIMNLSSVAANQPKVYIQWRWDGNWDYQWSLDDIELYDKNPTPPNDLSIVEFFYPPSNFATPASQIATDTFGFYLLLSNKGLEPQTNVKLKVWVEDEAGTLLHADSVLVPEIAAGVTDSAYIFDNSYIPALSEGKYFIKYSVRATEIDLRPTDNDATDFFVVTSGLFAKEDDANEGYRPSGTPDSWHVGNYYKMSAGSLETYKATSAEFAFTTTEAELPINLVSSTVYLLRVNDDVDADLTNLDSDEFLNSFSILSLNDYIAPDTLGYDYEPQTVDLIDFSTSDLGVSLEPGGRYVLAVGYTGVNNLVYHAFSSSHLFYFTSTLIYDTDWYSFGPDANAYLRLNISLVTSTDEKPLAAEAFSVFPSPAKESVNLAYHFEKPTDATITVADLTGRVISIMDKKDLTKGQETFAVKNLTAGVYLGRIATKEGTRTVKFVVE
jgi:hypothetical protein